MNRTPTSYFTPVLLALLLAGAVLPLSAEEKPLQETPAKTEVRKDEATAKPKNRSGLIHILRARKEEKQARKEQALAIREDSLSKKIEVPDKIHQPDPKKPGFLGSIFKTHPPKTAIPEPAGDIEKPESPKPETSPRKVKVPEAGESSPTDKAKKTGFRALWSQRKEAPQAPEAPALEADAIPEKKTGFRLPWSQRKEAPDANDAGQEPSNPPQKKKRLGFRWPWSQRKEAPPMAEDPVGESDPPTPPPLDPVSLLDIKPREPETGLAPTATPSPPGKKPNPLDDIGLYPER